MTNDRANSGSALRSLLMWILVLLVVANVAVWTARPFRDKLVALGILAPPPIERVDLDPQALPPIVEGADLVLDAEPAPESPAIEPLQSTEIDGVEDTVPPDTGLPPASPASSQIANEAPVAEQPLTALLGCVIVGPVESREELEAAATRLRSTGAVVDFPEGPRVVALDYLVYVEPSVSRDAARAVSEELRAQSIEDRAIIPSGTRENAVAVGVHHNRNLAEARRDQIAALGYSVNVQERHWLRAREVSTEALVDFGYKPCPDDEGG